MGRVNEFLDWGVYVRVDSGVWLTTAGDGGMVLQQDGGRGEGGLLYHFQLSVLKFSEATIHSLTMSSLNKLLLKAWRLVQA